MKLLLILILLPSTLGLEAQIKPPLIKKMSGAWWYECNRCPGEEAEAYTS